MRVHIDLTLDVGDEKPRQALFVRLLRDAMREYLASPTYWNRDGLPTDSDVSLLRMIAEQIAMQFPLVETKA